MLKGKWLRRGLMMALAFGLLWLLGLLGAAYHMTRRPHTLRAEPVPQFGGGPLEEHRLHSSDGEELGAWFLPGSPGKPAVLLLHGHGGWRRDCLAAAEVFAQAGCSVLLVSLRAHGDSTGDYVDYGYSARHDVVAAVAFLKQHCPTAPVVVRGVSLGAAAAVFSAELVDRDVAGWILESPYQNLRLALKHRTELLPWWLDHVAFAGLSLTGPLFLPDPDRIAPEVAIDAIPKTQPVLILAGACDDRARPMEARALLERVACHGKLVMFSKAGHESLLHADPQLYRQAVLELLDGIAR